MARKEEYDWIDDAFDESKPDPLAKKSERAPGKDYDWIDDAFDDSKEDPLAHKGMGGGSKVAVVLCAIIAVVVIVFLVLWALDFVAPLSTGAAL